MSYVRRVRVVTAWQAMDQRPLRFLASSWPWRSVAYLVSGTLLGMVTFAALLALAAGAALLALVLVGIGFGVALLLAGIPVARLERLRLRLVDDDPLPAPRRAAVSGPLAWPRVRLAEPATWRELGFAVLCGTALAGLDATVLGFAFVLPVLFALSPVDDAAAWPWVVVAVLLLATAPWTVTAWAGARAAFTRTVLAPRDDELGADIADVRGSRERLVGAFERERARIERDLHDGAQQRLVALGVTLGTARLDAPDGSALATRLDDARDQLGTALSELRDLVRGLDPRMLADHGLAAAVEERAERSTVPVAVDLRLPPRLPPHVATAAYFVLTEAMTNVARHSGATSASVTGRQHADQLVLEIRDGGRGGADPAAGSGLAGLAERVALVDGRLRLSSPDGGPTLLRVEIPCRSG